MSYHQRDAGQSHERLHVKTTYMLLVIAVLTMPGCVTFKRFDHQVALEHPHAVIEVIAPEESYYEVSDNLKRVAELGVPAREVIVLVNAIDGVVLSNRRGRDQLFRVKPGTHVIRYEMTIFETLPDISSTMFKEHNGQLGLLHPGHHHVASWYVHATTRKSQRVIKTVAGQGYVLRGFSIEGRDVEHKATP
jgi:hypothetical protein